MKFIMVFLCFFVQNFACSQSNQLVFLKGKIVCDLKGLSEINVTNLRSESATTTNNNDYSMFVKIGDTIQFSSLQILTKKVIIHETDLSKTLFVTFLEPKAIALDEVAIIEYKNINAVALGILSKPAKKYTTAERRLYTASSSPLESLLNSINGRKGMLKKQVEIEKKEMLLKKIEYQFEPEYFTNILKIPQDYVKGFWYFAIEEPKLVTEIKSNNKFMVRFVFAELATKYLELLQLKSE